MDDIVKHTENEIEKRIGLDVQLGEKDENGRRPIIVDGEKMKCVFDEDQVSKVMELHQSNTPLEGTIDGLTSLLKIELDQFDFDEKEYHAV